MTVSSKPLVGYSHHPAIIDLVSLVVARDRQANDPMPIKSNRGKLPYERRHERKKVQN